MHRGVWFDVLFLAMLCHYLSPAPPLTLENVLKAVEGMDSGQLHGWLNATITGSRNVSTAYIVEQFLQGQFYYQPSWRAVIFALDGSGKFDHANRIRHYAEPVPQGRYMIVQGLA